MEITDAMCETALTAFHRGPPGVLREVRQVDSYPGEYRGDPEAYTEIPTSTRDELLAMRDVLEAVL